MKFIKHEDIFTPEFCNEILEMAKQHVLNEYGIRCDHCTNLVELCQYIDSIITKISKKLK